MASTVKISPMTPNIIATSGTEINPAVLPCELDAIHTIIREETIVAIVDFLIIQYIEGQGLIKWGKQCIVLPCSHNVIQDFYRLKSYDKKLVSQSNYPFS